MLSPIRSYFLLLCISGFLTSFVSEAQAYWSSEEIRGKHIPGITFNLQPAFGLVSRCSIYSLEISGSDPIHRQKRRINAKMFQSLKSAQLDIPNTRTIIILPPSGGENAIDTLYAHLFCEAGFNVYILQDWLGNLENYELDPSSHDEEGLRGYSAVAHLLEFINPAQLEKVGLLGTSKGAIHGSVIMALESRIKTSVFIVGGADLPKILAVGTHSEVIKIRKKRMEHYRLVSVEDYEAKLREQLMLDPSKLAGGFRNKNMLFYGGLRDTTVPYKNQILLQHLALKAGANVESYAYDDDHTRTILAAFTNGRERFLNFFKEFVF